MTSLSEPRPAVATFPRGALLGAAGLVLLALLAAAAGRLAGLAPTLVPQAQPVTSIELRFADQADGSVAVYAEADGHLVELLPPGSNGFVRGVLRGFARERRRNEVGQAPPFRLTRWSDGRLSLADATTGRTVELEAFGPTNLAAFAGLLPGAERTP